MSKNHINFNAVVEMIVFCPDWREKEQILKGAVRKLLEIEQLEQIQQELDKQESEYE